jgi:hypothetical protein
VGGSSVEKDALTQ